MTRLTCSMCGQQFEAQRLDAKNCIGCRTLPDSLTRTCAEAGCGRPMRARGLCATHYNRAHHAGSQKRYPEDPERRRARLRERTRARRAAVYAVEAECFTEAEIYKRDGWRCGICHKAVRQGLIWPDPKMASLDHIVPLSQGGPHTRANIRLAHLGCNMARSNRGGGEQLALIG